MLAAIVYVLFYFLTLVLNLPYAGVEKVPLPQYTALLGLSTWAWPHFFGREVRDRELATA